MTANDANDISQVNLNNIRTLWKPRSTVEFKEDVIPKKLFSNPAVRFRSRHNVRIKIPPSISSKSLHAHPYIRCIIFLLIFEYSSTSTRKYSRSLVLSSCAASEPLVRGQAVATRQNQSFTLTFRHSHDLPTRTTGAIIILVCLTWIQFEAIEKLSIAPRHITLYLSLGFCDEPFIVDIICVELNFHHRQVGELIPAEDVPYFGPIAGRLISNRVPIQSEVPQFS